MSTVSLYIIISFVYHSLMARKIQDIELDISEIKQILLSVKRPNNQAVLAKHLSALKSQLDALAPPKIQQPVQPQVIPRQQPQKVQAPQSETAQKNIKYTPLTKYSWDQEGNKINLRIYFTLDGVGEQCKANQIDVRFQNQSVQLKLRDYKKTNLIFAIKKLCAPIELETATYLVKKNTICLTMYKKQNKHWAQLAYKEETEKQKKQEKDANPGDSLMQMMKKMYEQGDENMKRTIAEAWTKAQDKKPGDLGGMDDFGMGGMGGLGGLGGMGGMGGMGNFGGFRSKK